MAKTEDVISDLITSNPRAGIFGLLFSILAVVLSYFIHNDFIKDSFAINPGCCPIPWAMAIFLMSIYATVGFFIGYFISIAFQIKKKKKDIADYLLENPNLSDAMEKFEVEEQRIRQVASKFKIEIDDSQ
jgi:uncharacterized protein YneF (UPF0154 family)|tara:strand:+ start:1041 stop:1430 length:390 start_codon:yes stop_codon:yes gene_type:complete